MTTVHYEAKTRRLRIEGGCRTSDLSTVHEALDTFSQLTDAHLIVDLTAVTEIDQSVADELVAAAVRSRSRGGTVALVRKHGTSVDDAVTAAEQALRAR